VEVAPVAELIVEAARRNDKRPAFVKLAVPDELVKNLRGASGERDVVLLVRVPRELAARAESRIILPGE
jgi:hypothetical protein